MEFEFDTDNADAALAADALKALRYQYVGKSCKEDFNLCEPDYGATEETKDDSKTYTIAAKDSTNGRGMCCGVAQPPETPPADWVNAASDFKARYKDTLVCNYYNGENAQNVGIDWIPKTHDEPEGCLFADLVQFKEFRCMPAGALRLT